MMDDAPEYPGFTFVGEEVFGCGREVSMLRVYRFDLFHDAITTEATESGESGESGESDEDYRDSRSEFVEIPAATYRQGATESDIGAVQHLAPKHDSPLGRHETPIREVTLGTFLIARTPVTQEVWDGVAAARDVELWDQRNLEGRYIPVHGVRPEDIEPFLDAAGLKLPTESEWEWAARGGAETVFFHGSDPGGLKEFAWFGHVGEVGPMSVAQRATNAFGLFDMTGNVWELCADDWRDDYEDAPTDGSAVEVEEAMERVIRGGSFRVDSPTYLVPSYRSYTGVWSTPLDVGFRVVFRPAARVDADAPDDSGDVDR